MHSNPDFIYYSPIVVTGALKCLLHETPHLQVKVSNVIVIVNVTVILRVEKGEAWPFEAKASCRRHVINIDDPPDEWHECSSQESKSVPECSSMLTRQISARAGHTHVGCSNVHTYLGKVQQHLLLPLAQLRRRRV